MSVDPTWIKEGKKVYVHAIRARIPKGTRMLHLNAYHEKAVIVKVWKYPPDDPKFVVQVAQMRRGGKPRRLVVRLSEIGGQRATA